MAHTKFPRWLLILVLGSAMTLLGGQDTYCPRYPASERAFGERALETDLKFALNAASAGKPDWSNTAALPPVKNVIDEWIFRKMAKDGVEAAPTTTDNEFLRRIYVDLTGRIPTFEQAQAFLTSTTSNKRTQLIEDLLASPAYVDQLSHWYLERFRVRQGTGGWVSISGRNNFYGYIRDFVEHDRQYNKVVQEMLTASGDSDVEPRLGLLTRNVENYYDSPSQDFWDGFTDMATVQFLGFKTECISCHDGRRHLENINLFLTPHTRREFWRLSAFFSRTRIQAVSDDSAFFRPRLLWGNSTTGLYTGIIDPSRPGARPSRAAANEEPVYLFSGEKPSSGAWRNEFARLLTSDRQFARAAVNYLWAYFFGTGIVDPPDGWDLARVDPAEPPPEGWPMQNAHPELLEALTDVFIQSNYSTRSVVRLIVNSNTYQLSSRYPENKWQDAFVRYFARYEARRMTAEQLFDSLSTATGTEGSMSVDGLSTLLRYANQLPHPYASRDWETESLLDALGRGDWNNRRSIAKPSLFGILEYMNRWTIAARTRAWADQWTPQSRLALWLSQGLSDQEIIRRTFMATLTRDPSDDEVSLVLARKPNQQDTWLVRLWLSGLQWALIQKSDFVFKY